MDWVGNLTSGLDDMFSTQEIRDYGEIRTVDVVSIAPFKRHTFKVIDDEEMYDLAESIKQHGLLEIPIVFRNEDVQLEMISGHRRQRACQLAGLEQMPVLIKNVDRDEATIIMGETNLKKREKLLISEKAFTYREMNDAMKRLKGRKKELGASGTQLRTLDKISEISNESKDQIKRYIRLTYLIPELLELVDAERMAIRPAVYVSYLSEDLQNVIYDNFCETAIYNENGEIKTNGVLPSMEQAKMMYELYNNEKLDEMKISEILACEKPNQKVNKIVIKDEKLLKYKSGLTDRQFIDKITKALEYYDKFLEKNQREV